jgi:hypothetical protein
MDFNVKELFLDASYLSKVHTKAEYEKNMEMFKNMRAKHLEGFYEAEDLEQAAKDFCQNCSDAFKKFGKVRGGDLMNMNYFMIYYIFPTILEKGEEGIRICDTLRDVWNQHFKCNIRYADYATLMEGFQTRIFGIPIGKN